MEGVGVLGGEEGGVEWGEVVQVGVVELSVVILAGQVA